MRASCYVGRVGALAVGLGIGVAFAVSQSGSAAADSTAASPGVSAGQSAPGPGKTAAQRHSAARSAPAAAAPAAARVVSPASAAARRTATTSRPSAAPGRVPANPASVGAPVRPAQAPAIWALLAAVRREFFNSSPTITPVIHGQTTGESGRAVVTGNFGVADADGDSIYYTYIGDPQDGGSLSVDQATGDFTYTAPASMNELGGFDQFNIVVSDQTPGQFPHFHGIIDLLSRIPWLGPHIANTAWLFGLASPYTDSVPARIPISVAPTQPPAAISGAAAELSAEPIAAQQEWQRYVLTPPGCTQDATCTVRPVSIYYKNEGVTLGDNGEITLTYALGAEAPAVIVDYGQNVGGYTHYSIASATPNILHTAFSESLSNMSPIGDGAASTRLLGNSGATLTLEVTPVFGPGEWQNREIQGGYRYQRIALALPGTVTLSDVSTRITAPLRSADGYAGNFLSNSDVTNRIWYAGAYTINLDEISAGTPGYAGPYPLSILAEAAKRDRAIWAGDLLSAGTTLHDVFGEAGDVLARNNLQVIADNPVAAFVIEPLSLPFPVPSNLSTPGPAPGVCSGVSSGGCEFWGASYSMALAQNMGNYYRLTGDTAFVEQTWEAVKRSVAYGNSLINPATGLVDVPPIASLDWSVVNRAVGQVTSTNVVQYDSLVNAARLAEAIGDTASAEQYAAQAAALKKAINDNLWNPELGAYDASTSSRGFVVHDANSWAVYYGVADADQAAQIVQTMADTLTTDYGLRAAEAGVPRYPQIVSPFISSFSLPANYLAGRPDLATQQMLATWGYMVDTDAGSTTWERINLPGGNLAGTIPYLFGDSASHAWSTGATSSLSDYVLGITPTSVAYRTWQVKPFPLGLTFAQGRVPTTAGAIASRWELGEDAFRITVEAPDGTSGTVAVPTLGSSRVIFRDGVEVWDGIAGVDGVDAVATADGYVAFRNVTGAHTWAWSSP